MSFPSYKRKQQQHQQQQKKKKKKDYVILVCFFSFFLFSPLGAFIFMIPCIYICATPQRPVYFFRPRVFFSKKMYAFFLFFFLEVHLCVFISVVLPKPQSLCYIRARMNEECLQTAVVLPAVQCSTVMLGKLLDEVGVIQTLPGTTSHQLLTFVPHLPFKPR